MIRISTRPGDRYTAVTIDGRLAHADLEEVQRVRASLPGNVTLELGGLDACVEDGLTLLRDWLNHGATLHHAAPFLRMMLEDSAHPSIRRVDDSAP